MKHYNENQKAALFYHKVRIIFVYMLPFLARICVILCVMALNACSPQWPECVEPDDFGYPKIAVSAESGKPAVFNALSSGIETILSNNPNNGWMPTNYISVGGPLVVTTDIWRVNAKDISTYDLESRWMSGSGGAPAGCNCVVNAGPTPGISSSYVVGNSYSVADVFNSGNGQGCWFYSGCGLYAAIVPLVIENGQENLTKLPPAPQGGASSVSNAFHLLANYKDPGSGKSYYYNPTAPRGRLYLKIISSDYSQNKGAYIVRIKKGVIAAAPGISQTIISNICTPLLTATRDVFVNMVGGTNSKGVSQSGIVGKVIRATITLYLILSFISFMMGISELNQGEFFKRFFKLAIVLQLLSPNAWEFFNVHFFSIFRGGEQELMAMVASDSFITYDPINPISFVDQLFDLFFSSAIYHKIWALINSTLYGLIVGVIFYLVVILIFGVGLVKALFVYVLAFVIISILIMLFPLFLMFTLFEFTKELFDGWLKATINYTIQPVILFAFMGLFLGMILQQVYTLFGFRVCYQIYFNPFQAAFGILLRMLPFYKWQPFTPSNQAMPTINSEFYIQNPSELFPIAVNTSPEGIASETAAAMQRLEGILFGNTTPFISFMDLFLFSALIFLMRHFYAIVPMLGKLLAGSASSIPLGAYGRIPIWQELFGKRKSTDDTARYNRSRDNETLHEGIFRKTLTTRGVPLSEKALLRLAWDKVGNSVKERIWPSDSGIKKQEEVKHIPPNSPEKIIAYQRKERIQEKSDYKQLQNLERKNLLLNPREANFAQEKEALDRKREVLREKLTPEMAKKAENKAFEREYVARRSNEILEGRGRNPISELNPHLKEKVDVLTAPEKENLEKKAYTKAYKEIEKKILEPHLSADARAHEDVKTLGDLQEGFARKTGKTELQLAQERGKVIEKEFEKTKIAHLKNIMEEGSKKDMDALKHRETRLKEIAQATRQPLTQERQKDLTYRAEEKLMTQIKNQKENIQKDNLEERGKITKTEEKLQKILDKSAQDKPSKKSGERPPSTNPQGEAPIRLASLQEVTSWATIPRPNTNNTGYQASPQNNTSTFVSNNNNIPPSSPQTTPQGMGVPPRNTTEAPQNSVSSGMPSPLGTARTYNPLEPQVPETATSRSVSSTPSIPPQQPSAQPQADTPSGNQAPVATPVNSTLQPTQSNNNNVPSAPGSTQNFTKEVTPPTEPKPYVSTTVQQQTESSSSSTISPPSSQGSSSLRDQGSPLSRAAQAVGEARIGTAPPEGSPTPPSTGSSPKNLPREKSEASPSPEDKKTSEGSGSDSGTTTRK